MSQMKIWKITFGKHYNFYERWTPTRCCPPTISETNIDFIWVWHKWFFFILYSNNGTLTAYRSKSWQVNRLWLLHCRRAHGLHIITSRVCVCMCGCGAYCEGHFLMAFSREWWCWHNEQITQFIHYSVVWDGSRWLLFSTLFVYEMPIKMSNGEWLVVQWYYCGTVGKTSRAEKWTNWKHIGGHGMNRRGPKRWNGIIRWH